MANKTDLRRKPPCVGFECRDNAGGRKLGYSRGRSSYPGEGDVCVPLEGDNGESEEFPPD